MHKALVIIAALLALSPLNESSAQATRSLSGSLTLDVSPNERDRNIEITVSNHSIVVIPPTILRPITSKESAVVLMPAGSSTVNYSIAGIITDPVDYTVAIRCIGCSDDLPTQYYTPTGNNLGLVRSAYIDPDDLPNTLNLTAITHASISGNIALNTISERDLQFGLTVFSSDNPELSLKTLSQVTLAAGTSEVPYSITGIRRSIGANQFRVRLKCTNCIGSSRRTQVFARPLPPNQNHTGINFMATDVPLPPLTPILFLLLD